MPNALSTLLTCVADQFQLHPAESSAGIVEALHRSCCNPIVRHPQLVATAQHRLAPLLPNTPTGISDALSGALPLLSWWKPDPQLIPADFIDGMLVTELLGPDGMVQNADYRAGLYIQNSNIDYTWHSHAAEELYIAVTGTAEWQIAGELPARRPPGSCILHTSGMSHAMRTANEPMLALWAWTGNISFSTYRMD